MTFQTECSLVDSPPPPTRCCGAPSCPRRARELQRCSVQQVLHHRHVPTGGGADDEGRPRRHRVASALACSRSLSASAWPRQAASGAGAAWPPCPRPPWALMNMPPPTPEFIHSLTHSLTATGRRCGRWSVGIAHARRWNRLRRLHLARRLAARGSCRIALRLPQAMWRRIQWWW